MNKIPLAPALLSIGLISGCAGGPANLAEVDCSERDSPASLGRIAYFGFLGNFRDSDEDLSVSDGEKDLVFRYNEGVLEGDINSSLQKPGEVLAELPTATVYAGTPSLIGAGFTMGVASITILCRGADPIVVYSS